MSKFAHAALRPARFIPILMQGPFVAAQAGRPCPLVGAARTSAVGEEGVPGRAARLERRLGTVTAPAQPSARRLGFPLAARTPDPMERVEFIEARVECQHRWRIRLLQQLPGLHSPILQFRQFSAFALRATADEPPVLTVVRRYYCPGGNADPCHSDPLSSLSSLSRMHTVSPACCCWPALRRIRCRCPVSRRVRTLWGFVIR